MRVGAKFLAAPAALLAAIASSPARGLPRGRYPDHPVKIIAPFAAGGPTDVISRIIAQKLTDSLKQQFFVENHVGAGGNLGMSLAARSTPDGYTILVASSSYVVNPSLYANNPYDPYKDFIPITVAAASPNILSVHPSVPAKTMKELIALIQANPGKYSIANAGLGTTPQLASELFKLTYKLDAPSVPYNGGEPAVQSVVGNHTPIAFSAIPPAAPQITRRQYARPRRHRGEALGRAARRADHGGSRHPGPGIRDHARHVRAGGNAAGYRRAAAQRDRQGDAVSRREREMRRPRLRRRRQ